MRRGDTVKYKSLNKKYFVSYFIGDNRIRIVNNEKELRNRIITSYGAGFYVINFVTARMLLTERV